MLDDCIIGRYEALDMLELHLIDGEILKAHPPAGKLGFDLRNHYKILKYK